MERVLEGYSLLQEEMGVDRVEDIASFWGTVSPSTDSALVPKLVAFTHRGRMQGIVVGAYLKDLNMGMVHYSGVRTAWRGRGLYATLKGHLIALLNREAGRGGGLDMPERSPGIGYLISELDEDGPLYRRYLERWGAFVLACSYEQPDAQGLRATPMKLVLQPTGRRTPPTRGEAVSIVREIYEHVYRLSDIAENPRFRRVVDSLGDSPAGVNSGETPPSVVAPGLRPAPEAPRTSRHRTGDGP